MRWLVLTTAVAVVACSPPGPTNAQEGGASPAAPGTGAKPDSLQQPASGGPGAITMPTLPQAPGGADQPCTLANTTGVWSLVHIQSGEPGVQEFYRRAPHEYMRISANGAYAYFAATQAVAPGDVNLNIDQADAGDGVNDVADFRIPGVFVVLRNGQPFQAVQCFIAGSAAGNHQAGDMVWTGYEGAPDLYRVQRRLS